MLVKTMGHLINQSVYEKSSMKHGLGVANLPLLVWRLSYGLLRLCLLTGLISNLPYHSLENAN